MALLGAGLLAVGGCSTYGERMETGREHLRQGDTEAADAFFAENLAADGDERLLHHLERGTVAHIAGDYTASNRHLAEAERAAEARRDELLEQRLQALASNPANAPYAPMALEQVYINYFRMLNYAFLAREAVAANRPEEALQNLDAARVESRRITMCLDRIAEAEGTYDDAAEARQSLFGRLMRVFEVLRGQWVDQDWLVYRDDAYLRYLSGIVFEMLDEPDNARIAYENAAELYESGFAEQYNLGQAMAEQAWADTARVMATSGGYDPGRIAAARDKLGAAKEAELDRRLAAHERGQPRGEVVVLNHVGLIPQRRELNMVLYINERSRAFVLRPIPIGTEAQQDEQFRWFFTQYADTGALHVVKNYMAGGAFDAVAGVFTKRFPLGPAWDTAESLGLPQAVGPLGVRVTVPYYPPTEAHNTYSELRLSARSRGRSSGHSPPQTVETRRLYEAAALDRVALQTQLLASGEALRGALARELVKNMAADRGGDVVTNQAGGGWGLLFELAGRVAASATARAETRSWQTLPRRIHMRRVSVAPGTYDLAVTTYDRTDKQLARKTREVTVAAGEIDVAAVTSLPPAGHTPPPAPGTDDAPLPVRNAAPAGDAVPLPPVLPSDDAADVGES